MMRGLRRNPRTALAMRILMPFAFGYFLSYFLRTVNAVIAPDLIHDLGLNAQSLGLLTSVYFLAFAAFQLPLGALLDQYGPRRTQFTLLLIAACGALLFAFASSINTLLIGRALIGLGVSACLMAAFKSFTQWFHAARLPLINGLQMISGGLGALAATRPVEWMLGFLTWRQVFAMLAVLSIVAAVAVLWTPRRRRQSRQTWSAQMHGIGTVFRDPLFRAIAPWSTLSQGASLALQSLWVGPWLYDVARLPRDAVASWLALSAMAIIIGFATFGCLADYVRKRGIAPLTVAVVGMSLFALCFAVLAMPMSGARAWLWLPFAFFGTSGILCYAVLSQHFPAHLAGRANTALNLLVFCASFVVQWGMGAIIDLWPAQEDGHFASQGYRVSLLILLALQILGATWFFYRYAKLRQKLKSR